MDSPRMYLSTNWTSSLKVAELTPYILHPLTTRQMDIDLDEGVKVNYPKLGAALKKIPGLEAKKV